MRTPRQVISLLFIFISTTIAAQTYLSGVITGSFTWTKEASPYIITDSLIVHGELHIDPGTVVMFRYHPDPQKKSYMVLEERIFCEGSADDPVVFTSERDDTYGDLNGDSTATVPGPGDWGFIHYNGGTIMVEGDYFRYTNFRYGGGRDPGGITSPEFYPMLSFRDISVEAYVGISNCTIQYSAGAGILNGSAYIRYSTISDCSHGVFLQSTLASIQNSIITRNAGYPVYMRGMQVKPWLYSFGGVTVILGVLYDESNTIEDNGHDYFAIEGDIVVPGGEYPDEMNILWKRSILPYLVTGPLRFIYPDEGLQGTVSIEKGTLIKFKHFREDRCKPYIEIHPRGRLTAGIMGSASGDVVFTSEYDHRYDYEPYSGNDRDPMPGDWGYIEATDLELKNCVFKYGGVYANPHTGKVSSDSSAVLRIRSGDASDTVLMEECLLNSLYKNGIVILSFAPQGFQIHNNSFLLSKDQYGIRVLRKGDIAPIIYAEENYWNGKLGPFHPRYNPSGNGCLVGNDVVFDPCLTSSDDELSLVSSVVRGTTMNQDEGILPNVLVRLIGKKEQSVYSKEDGSYYISNVYPGYGYKLQAFASCHHDTILQNIEVLKDTSHVIDVNLTEKTIDYLVDTITFKVNPDVSEVQEGGTAYRYYKIIDRPTRDPVYGTEVFVNGLVDTFYTNYKGIVKIPVSSSRLDGYPGGRNFYISQVGLETLPYPPEMRMNFRVNPLPRDYTKMWAGKLWLKAGISVVELKAETGASIGLAMLDQGSGEEPAELILERGFQVGAGINLGASAKATLGPLEAGAEAKVGVNLNGLMKDQFRFDYEITSGKQALAKFIVLAGSAFQYLDSPLHRYLGVALLDKNEEVAKAQYSNSVGLNLHGYGSAEAGLDINLLGKKGLIGAELKGNAEAVGDIDFLFTAYTPEEMEDQMDFELSFKAEIGAGASAGVGLDLAELFGGGDEGGGDDKKNGDDDDDGLDADFLNPDLLAAGVSAGVKFGASISTSRGIPSPYTSLGFMYGYKYEVSAEAAFVGSADASADREYDFKFDLHDSYLKGIVEDKVQLAHEIANTDISNLSLDISSLSGAKIFKSPLATFAAEQTKNAFSFPAVPYNQTVTDLVGEGEFPVEISFGLGPVKAKFGAGIEYTEANEYLWKSGVFYNWKLYPLQTYDYVAENEELGVGPILQDILTESGKYMWDRIKEALNPLPQIFKKIRIWPFKKIRWKGDEGYYRIPVGPDSRNSYLVADSLTTSEDSLFVYYWDWYGTGEAHQTKATMDPSALRILEHVKAKATELHKLDYGIGGFYQFEPNGMLIADSAVLTINYSMEDLEVMLPDSTQYTIDENDLRMYVEDKSNNRWIYVGGVVEPDSNFVTARIDSLGTFTLAPFTPDGEITLTASPDTIIVGEADSSYITSGMIYYNTGLMVQNEEFTIEASKGTIAAVDTNPDVEGIQIKSESGRIGFDYWSDSISGVAYLKAISRMGSAAGLTTVVINEKVAPQPPVITSAVLEEYSVELSWDPSPDIDVAHYEVCFGTQSGPPYLGTASVVGESSPVIVGTVTEASLEGLFKDSTYYFAVRAVDRCGNASEYSNEMTLDTRFNYQPVIYSRVFKIDPILPAGTVIDAMWADDEDRDQELRFFLAANNTCTAFSLDAVTGEIIVKDAAQLDYWLTGVSSFLMHVGVRDNAEPPKADSTEVLIVLNVITGMRRAPLPHEPRFNIYPNPATDELNVELKGEDVGVDASICIVNLNGQLLMRKEIRKGAGSNHKLNLSGIPAGMYSVVVESQSGRAVQRLVLIR